MDEINQDATFSNERAIVAVNSYLPKVYRWMAIGLALTAIASMLTLSIPALQQLVFGSRMTYLILIFAELGLVMYLSARISKISASTATMMFMAYSLLNGVTFAAIFAIYTSSSIVSTFVITAGTFGSMSLYGYVTKRDLTGIGNFLMMGLFGIIIASVVNIFMHSAMITWMVSYLGVFIFIGLTAYDTQKLKRIGAAGFADGEHQHKATIMGALTLYLDFINLFLFMLRIFGNRR
jgi:FtsH-binding integral membrane protein